MGVFGLRTRWKPRTGAVSLRRLLAGGQGLDLAAILAVYDGALAALQRLHERGTVHGAVTDEAVCIDVDGGVTLPPCDVAAPLVMAQPLAFARAGDAATWPAAAQDVYALSEVLVEALTGRSDGRLTSVPVATRDLLGRGLASGPGPRASAADLRVDVAAVGLAFFGDGWRELGAAGLAAAVAQRVGTDATTAVAGSSRPRLHVRRRLTGAAMGAVVLVATLLLVAFALDAIPISRHPPGGAGLSGAVRTAPSGAVVGPAVTAPASPGIVTTAPSSPSISGRPRPIAVGWPGATPEPGSASPSFSAAATPQATSAVTASPAPSPSGTATPTPPATPTASPTPTPSPSASPKPTP